ncbi:MAG: gliding motility-associated C-terminal domain-containing protein [Bacteroidetes bacterium]|nr:gliding motility-associated C-terminal domain-containing protein [Bacteroidota bacterium]
MSRFEDQFKNAFDHFEPEVDPKLWQQISQQLPSVPQNPGVSGSAGTAGKGLVAQLGIKGIAALLTVATLTILGVNYLIQKDEKAVEKNSPALLNESTLSSDNSSSFALPSEQEKVQNEPVASSSQEINPSSEKTGNTSSENKIKLDQKITIENALTGDFNKEKGESTPRNDSPAPALVVKSNSVSVTKPVSSNSEGEFNNQTQPVAPIQKTVKPVLILSTKGGFAPLTVTALTNQEGNVNAVFDFGDGKSSMVGSTANNTFEEPGNYTVTCEINGITIEEKVTVFGKVPSAFSPNGDGINDVLTITKDASITIEIRIFNRNGKLMFIGKGNNISWDGTFEGRNADAGTYMYNIFATSDGEATFKQKGTINLFR